MGLPVASQVPPLAGLARVLPTHQRALIAHGHLIFVVHDDGDAGLSTVDGPFVPGRLDACQLRDVATA